MRSCSSAWGWWGGVRVDVGNLDAWDAQDPPCRADVISIKHYPTPFFPCKQTPVESAVRRRNIDIVQQQSANIPGRANAVVCLPQTDDRRPEVMAWASATDPNRKFRQGGMKFSCAALWS
jgi:hypothetical protein